MQHKPWIEALESALRVVEGDVRASGLDGSVGLIPNDWAPDQYVYAVFQGSGSGNTVGIEASQAEDPVGALVAVADDLQNSVMHVLWGTVWPVCPTHDLGAHTREHDGVAVWWCNSLGGHVIAPMGQPVAATVCRYTGSIRNGSRTARAIAYEVSAACALTCPSPGQRCRGVLVSDGDSPLITVLSGTPRARRFGALGRSAGVRG
jgi:hypothetical protein